MITTSELVDRVITTSELADRNETSKLKDALRVLPARQNGERFFSVHELMFMSSELSGQVFMSSELSDQELIDRPLILSGCS